MSVELAGRPAADLARECRAGEVTASAIVQAHLERAALQDPSVGAFQLLRSERALEEARVIDRDAEHRAKLPLAGVPVAIKDNVPVMGEPMRVGSRASSPTPADRDHVVVQRLRAAGAIVIGTTRTPELCLWGTSDNAFGTARSPWKPDRTAGGSSGGSAAAVAAAMVPIAHGNDGLGSIRIPAACCGLVGFKPGPDVVPSDLGPNSWYGLAENGALATTVADAALMLSVLSGNPSLAAVHEPGRVLRIGLATAPPAIGLGTDRELADRARDVAHQLAALGHVVVEVKPPMPSPLEALAILGTWCAGARDEVDVLLEHERDSWDLLERRTRTHVRMGDLARRLGLTSDRHRRRWRARMDRWFHKYDVLMTPTLATPPIAADGWRDRSWLANVAANLRYTPFCGPVNFARLPAIAVPAGVHADGTPASVHFVGPARSEALLLGIAMQVERVRPWRRHPPRLPGRSGDGVDSVPTPSPLRPHSTSRASGP